MRKVKERGLFILNSSSFSSAKSNEILPYGFTAPEIVKYVDSLEIYKSDNLFLPTLSDTLNIGVAQVAVRRYNSLEDYVREINFLVSQAINEHAHIICFPAFTGLLPASLFPQYDKVVANLQLNSRTGFPHSVWINQAISVLGSECFEVHRSTMSSLAAAHGVYIMSGSTIYPEKSMLQHRAHFFNPEGKIIGFQDKIAPTSLERDLQIEAGREIKKFETPLGSFSILIGSDVNYFETVKVAYELGSQIILNPTAFPGEYTSVSAAAGLNLRVQENPVYGVQSTLSGNTNLGFRLSGPSGVFAPVRFSLHNAKNGLFTRTIKQDQTQILTARLDLNALKEVADPLLSDGNQDFLTQHIDKIY